jgi:hypothetical protein
MLPRPAVVSIAVLIAALMFGACSTGSKAADTSVSSSSSTTPSLSPATTQATPDTTDSLPPTTVAAPTTTVAPATTVAPGTTTTVASTCAQRAADTYIHVVGVTSIASGGLTLTGNATTLVCGGPDDYHFNSAVNVEIATVVAGATIQVLPLTEDMQLKSISESQFAGYLATDMDTRIFLVTGPLSGVTGLQEQFHP